MATIRRIEGKRGACYRVEIRVKGCKPMSCRKPTLEQARAWAAENEAKARQGRSAVICTPLAEVLDRYEREILPRLAESTRPTVRGHLRGWRESLGNLPLEQITIAVASKVRSGMVARGFSPYTANHYVTTLSAVLTAAWREWQLIPTHPLRGLRRLPEPQGRLRFLSPDELLRLVAACRASRSRYLLPAVVLSLATGMRRGELLGLTWDRVDLRRGVILLTTTKNKKPRSVPIVGPAQETLRKLQAERDQVTPYVIPSHDGTCGLDLRTPWETALREAAVDDFRWHDMRHTAASYLVMHGVHLRVIGEILGHKALATTMRYAHLFADHLTPAAEQLQTAFFGAAPDFSRLTPPPPRKRQK